MTRAAGLLLLISLSAAACRGSTPSESKGPGDPARILSETLRRYGENSDAAAALEGVDEVIRLQPESAEAHTARGGLLRALGRPQEALASYGRALELQPAHLTARASRGLLLADLGRSDDAGRDFAALIEAAPASPDGYLLRAWLERGQGRFSESERDLAESRARDPGRWE